MALLSHVTFVILDCYPSCCTMAGGTQHCAIVQGYNIDYSGPHIV